MTLITNGCGEPSREWLETQREIREREIERELQRRADELIKPTAPEEQPAETPVEEGEKQTA